MALSEEHRQKISKSLKEYYATHACPPRGMKGKHHSEETKKRISESNKGKHRVSEETRRRLSEAHKGQVPWSKGLRFSEEYRKKLSDAHKGHCHTEEHKQKIGEAMSGPNHWNWGQCRSAETKRKISQSRKNKCVGIDNPNWRGGMSALGYPIEFGRGLKEQIRERDGRACQLCSRTKAENGRRLDVHHIDYNKSNCDPLNLIALCSSCNLCVNSSRVAWGYFFMHSQIERFLRGP